VPRCTRRALRRALTPRYCSCWKVRALVAGLSSVLEASKKFGWEWEADAEPTPVRPASRADVSSVVMSVRYLGMVV